MIKYIVIIVLVLLPLNVGASELLGTISTDPNDVHGPGEKPDDDKGVDVTPKETIGSSVIFLKNQKINKDKTEAVQVLGVEFYPDGSLIRGEDMKIYIIRNGAKKYISSLEELKQYAGQKIYDVSQEQLDEYEARNYFEGDLIRGKGDVKVYVIKNGKGQHILSLEELRRHYFGQEIYNIKSDEMKIFL